MSRCRRAALVAVAVVATVAARGGRAQDLSCQAGDREVRTLRFEGNGAFPSTELASVVVTTPSSALSRLRVVGTRRCLDPDEFPRDVLRLQAYYRKRGYTSATVDTTVRQVGTTSNGARRIVDVTFRVAEGAPLRIDTLVVSGLDALPQRAAVLKGFPLRRGSVFDRVALEASRDTIVQRLHNSGYLRADALQRWTTDVEQRTANAWLTVMPGPFTRVTSVVVRFDTTGAGAPQVPEAVVRRTLGIRVGDPYSASDIIQAQRILYQTDIYRRVEVRVDTTGLPDSLVTLVVGLQEGNLHTARVSAGWATLDCFRTQGDFTDRYFLPRAQRLELQARLSKIGIGKPLGGAGFLCPQAQDDSAYSNRLNYYLGATLGQPTTFRRRRVPSLTLFTSRVSEYKAFRRQTTIGANISLTSRPGSRLPSTWSYQFEVGRTEADQVIFCAIFSACDPRARDALTGNRPLGAIGYAAVRDRTDDPLAPTRGNLERLTLRHSSLVTGSDATQRFNKGVADATWYRRVGDVGMVGHVQLGGVLGAAPQQERLFAGGPTTVRGFAQNELGPAVYLVSRFVVDTLRARADTVYRVAADVRRADRTIPTGGNMLVVGNLEATLPSPVLPDLLQFAVFTDAGEVWDRDNPAAAFRGLRVTPGAGVRVKSLFGVIRVDLGYNAYGLRGGQAYYIQSTESGQALYCVSPGNQLRVTGTGTGLPRQDPGVCPASFEPSVPRHFLSRLNPSIWIGNAF